MSVNVNETPSRWCISFVQLLEIEELAIQVFGRRKLPRVTMRDVCQRIIIPRCEETGTSYALSLNPDGLEIDTFVTHSWDGHFAAFVQSLRDTFQTSVTKPNLWICAFALLQSNNTITRTTGSNNSTSIAQSNSLFDAPLEDSPFVRALQKASAFCVVRNQNTDLYTRIWCVCELMYAKKYGLFPAQTRITGPDAFSTSSTSCVNADATCTQDKIKILKVLLVEHDALEIDKIVQLFRTHEISTTTTSRQVEDSGTTADQEQRQLGTSLLTVFQASPLAYEDFMGKENPIPYVDLDAETVMLEEALEKTGLNVAFETATPNSLGSFLSQGNKCLHFSCHGHPEYLFIEDGYGGGQKLLVDDNLKGWIRAGGNNLAFVFVSACHSRTAGEAFIDAGVQHVVCCEQDEDTLSNTAAMVFSRDFYRAAANGRTLKQAFDLAVYAVIHSPELLRRNREQEAKKFSLLPEGANHNVVLFTPFSECDHSSYGSLNASKTSSSPRIPVAPQIFVGRELDMYRILRALFVQKSRLVRIAGPHGIGKISVAKALGNYVEKRQMWGDTLWLPPTRKGSGPDNITSHWYELFALIENPTIIDLESNDAYNAVCQKILDYFYEKKVLAIIDGKTLPEAGLRNLCTFLDDVFEKTRHMKVIVVHQDDVGACIQSRNPAGFPCIETVIVLPPLSFDSTVSLFGSVSQHALLSDNWSKASLLKKPGSLYEVIGGGVPAQTLIVAKNMSRDEYDKLTGAADGLLRDKHLYSGRRNSNRGAPNRDSSDAFSARQDASRAGAVSSSSPSPPPLRSQAEVFNRFAPLLRKEGKVYRKNVTSFIRRAIKGERVVTTIDGALETEQKVSSDNCWVVCGRAAGEYYVVSDTEFQTNYDATTAKEISLDDLARSRRLRQQGFLEYRSCRRVWARKVDENDMNFFRHNVKPPEGTIEAYFVAPWGESMRVEQGDFLVMQYPGGIDEIYRIECCVFGYSYTNIDDDDTSQSMLGLPAGMLALGGMALSVAAFAAFLSRRR